MQMKGETRATYPSVKAPHQPADGAEGRVSIVVHADREVVVLEPIPGDEQATILAALSQLQAGGSTAGEAGIKLADAIAERAG